MRFKLWQEYEDPYVNGIKTLTCSWGQFEVRIESVAISTSFGQVKNEISVIVKRLWDGSNVASMAKYDACPNITEAKDLAENMAEQLSNLV